MKTVQKDTLYHEIRLILTGARQTAYRAVNFTMVIAYWEIGKRIVQEEQGGKEKAAYGQGILKELSRRLTAEFGNGFDESNLRYIRLFYLAFPIRDALRHELSWTHYRLLSKTENEAARTYYLNEAITQNWSTRALERQINSFYYERLLSSKQKTVVEAEAKTTTDKLAASPEELHQRPFCTGIFKPPEGQPFQGKGPGGGHHSKPATVYSGTGERVCFCSPAEIHPGR